MEGHFTACSLCLSVSCTSFSLLCNMSFLPPRPWQENTEMIDGSIKFTANLSPEERTKTPKGKWEKETKPISYINTCPPTQNNQRKKNWKKRLPILALMVFSRLISSYLAVLSSIPRLLSCTSSLLSLLLRKNNENLSFLNRHQSQWNPNHSFFWETETQMSFSDIDSKTNQILPHGCF